MVKYNPHWLKLPEVIKNDSNILFKSQALKEYNNSSKYLSDITCAQFFKILEPLEILNNQILGIEKLPKYYKQLKTSSWIADLETAISIDSNINKHVTNLNGLNNFELFVRSAFNNCLVIYISEDINLDQSIFDNQGLKTKIEQIFLIIKDNCNVNIDIYNRAGSTNLISWSCFTGKNSNIKLHIEDNFLENTNSIQSFNWNLEEAASLYLTHKLASTDLNILIKNFNLVGNNSNVEYIARLKSKKNHKIISYIDQNHIGVNTKSKISLKSVTEDNSNLFARGLIDIGAQAANAQASLELLTISTSQSAKNCAIPTLQVKNSQVSCRHASATGSVNNEHVWYLQSRGLDNNKAKNLIIEGFLN